MPKIIKSQWKTIIFRPEAVIEEGPVDCETCGQFVRTLVTEGELVQCLTCWREHYEHLRKVVTLTDEQTWKENEQ